MEATVGAGELLIDNQCSKMDYKNIVTEHWQYFN